MPQSRGRSAAALLPRRPAATSRDFLWARDGGRGKRSGHGFKTRDCSVALFVVCAVAPAAHTHLGGPPVAFEGAQNLLLQVRGPGLRPRHGVPLPDVQDGHRRLPGQLLHPEALLSDESGTVCHAVLRPKHQDED